MNRSSWQFKWFKPEEFDAPGEPGTGLLMDRDVVRRLNWVRGRLGHPIIVHRNGGFARRGHSEGSYHYQGRAVDFHVIGMALRDVFPWLIKAGFLGIGVYTSWNNPGFHVDNRVRFALWFDQPWSGGLQYFYPTWEDDGAD